MAIGSKKTFGTNSSQSVTANLEARKKGLANAAKRRMGGGGSMGRGTLGSSGLANAESIQADRTKRFQKQILPGNAAVKLGEFGNNLPLKKK
jgi:hypothetical protein